MASSDHPERAAKDKGDETLAFLALALVLFPILSIVLVGGYGFLVWMQQILIGPPGS